MHAGFLHVDRLVGMPAEDAVGTALPGKGQRSRSHFRRHAQPSRVQPVNQPRQRLAFQIHLLQPQIKRRAPAAEPHAIHLKSVELVAMNRDVPQAAVFPRVMLIHANPHQVRHDIRQPVIVIAFHPDNFNVALGVRKLANVAEKLPVIFRKAGKIEIGKNVAQQNHPLKAVLLEYARGLARITGLCSQMQIGKDQRVVPVQIHIPVVAADCYGLMNSASILVHR